MEGFQGAPHSSLSIIWMGSSFNRNESSFTLFTESAMIKTRKHHKSYKRRNVTVQNIKR